MIRVGIAGLGFMGMVHYLTYQKLRGVKVTAICDVIKERLTGDWRGIKGNFGPLGKRMDLNKVDVYSSIDEMLSNPDLDLIDITLPPFLHADVAIKAMKEGKDVFSEKPMSLCAVDCRRMLNTSERTGKSLFVGQVLPFFPEYSWAMKVVQSGKYGKLLGGSFKRVISDPSWLTHYWSAEQVGGPMLDLHVHDAHFITLMFGLPSAVITHGRMRGDLAENWHSLFYYDDLDLKVHATSGTINQQGRVFDHGFEIHLEQATLTFEFAVIRDQGKYLCPPTLFDKSGRAQEAKLVSGDPMNAFATELEEVATCLRHNRRSPILNPRIAHDAVLLCEKQTQSLRQGRKINI
ncbi:Gfo/Idh/MocA family protein [Bythopirellula polymerisocia]|uniref:Glucose--fructose oxidoreductase n=1 Tax=Bythopirellula polymerisocia TaxID=2528003 RepID=A0A5C6C839_9BACT|nr:Gfo/Idh/MocA family oxidoreductase [Bythopirellula polymerisocia]TWU20750.1 Glucose--fructose oxidoreductase precursor [Bythopirellula polymerisocia]